MKQQLKRNSLLTLRKFRRKPIRENDKKQRRKKRREWGKVFDWLRFWLTFGFWAPAKYKIDFADDKVVRVTLSILEKRADMHHSRVEALKQEFMTLEVLKRLLAKRTTLRSAQKDNIKAERKLAEACRIAVKYGFQPVARYQILWDRAQEKERVRRVKKVNA